ncbi:MAG: disulfide bond formation protein B [Gammaproteobacteria bacterium]
MFSQRALFIYGLVLCVALMATALYFQYVMELEPCPLCAIQRLLVIAVGVVMLVGAVHDPAGFGRKVYGVLTLIPAVLGVVVAGRHVWLQNLPPDEVPACGPGLNYLMDTLPFNEMLEEVFRGSGECAEVQWQFLGLTIPGWTLVIFIAMVAFAIYLVATRRPATTG